MFESCRPSSPEHAKKCRKSPNSCDLPSMLATLCSYEDRFGRYHSQTLILMTQLGVAYWQAGQFDRARPLLERAARDLARNFGRECDARLQALTALQDLYSTECDFDRAEAIRRELCGWQKRPKQTKGTQTVNIPGLENSFSIPDFPKASPCPHPSGTVRKKVMVTISL